MKKNFNISEDELKNFAIKIYQEACYGYLDLADSATEILVQDFLKDRVHANQFVSVQYNSIRDSSKYVPHVSEASVSENFLPSTNLIEEVSLVNTPVINHVLVSFDAPFVRIEDNIRQQEYVRFENYHGNESERL
jgi:hypothetical protein